MMYLTQHQFDVNQRKATKLQSLMPRIPLSRVGQDFVRAVVNYLANTATGYYSSYLVEQYYLRLANKYKIEISSDYQRNTCLLVTSSVSGTGGHARVMERWIETDKTRVYSIAVINESLSDVDQKSRIVSAVRESGGVIFALEGDWVAKALELREKASHYESIVLFTFPWDIEHIIAFGCEGFKRPVGFYNAPDHMFWLGGSVTDILADIRSRGADVSRAYRGFIRSMIVPVPASKSAVPSCSSAEARDLLGIPHGVKLLVSAARFSKFIPCDSDSDYTTWVDPLLQDCPDLYVICIGARPELFNSDKAFSSMWTSRVKFLDYVSHEDLLLYFRAADVVFDSFPMCGITTLEDAVFCGTPILSHASSIDWVVNSPALVNNPKEFVNKALLIFNDSNYRMKHVETMCLMLENAAGEESFLKCVDSFMKELCGISHRIREYVPVASKLTHLERIRSSEGFVVRKKDRVFSWVITSVPYCISLYGCYLLSVSFNIMIKMYLRFRNLRRMLLKGN